METTTETSNAAAPLVDRFELIEQLSRGSLGFVYKAKDTKLNRIVAFRQFELPDWLDDVNALLQRILLEGRAANQLQHPNIVRLCGGGHKETKVFLASDFIEGPTLREVLSKRLLTMPECFAIAKQLCSVIDYAADRGVMHHFLNPCNLKLLPDGTLRVLDYGLIQHRSLLSPTPAKRIENQHYLSPEQIKKQHCDKASNIFNVGIILYEIFTTRNPFAGKHLAEVEKNITEIEPPPMPRVHQRVPDEISEIILKALAKNPAERYASCEDLAAALSDCETQIAQGKLIASAPAASSTPKISGAGGALMNGAPPSGSMPAAALGGAISTGALKPEKNGRRAAGPDWSRIQAQWKPIAATAAMVVIASFAAIYAVHQFGRRPAPELSDAARTEQAAKRLTARLDEQILKSAPSPSKAETQPEAPAPAPVPEPRVRVERPERKAPVAVATGELSVASAPDGAKIEVDGQSGRNWVTPQVFASLLPGNHTVTVSKTGYSTEIRNIEVLRGRRALLQVKLSATRGMLNVAGTPPGARIVVNGKDTGRVTPAEIVLDPGSHSIRVHKDGYLDSNTSVSIRAGETLSLSPSLTMAGRTDTIKVVGGIGKMFGGSGDMGRIQIRSSPRGAFITINQMRLEKPTPVSIQLDPGTYEITLEMLGYRPLRKVVVVGAGQKLEIDENLSKY